MNNLTYFPSRVIAVWSLTIILTGLLMGLWYILQPTLVFTSIQVDNSLEDAGLNSTDTDQVITLLKLSANVFIPIMILGLWLWAFVYSASKKSYRGEEYYYG